MPERGAGASVAILPDARGAHEPYRLPARKFAGSGNTAGVTRHRDRSPDADGFARRGAVADRPDHAADARRHVLAFTRKESA
ncbi:hypothetical protein [Actinokineospora enzanensis]|uniref:hypothetical protein n=1 Tax=Actinokineospora enzanensis TaxID=155975 RepID=UPI0012EC72AB|nr:hypothetical protein [Actinokineospora enzanensis]